MTVENKIKAIIQRYIDIRDSERNSKAAIKHECEECFDTGIRIIKQRPCYPGGSIHVDCYCTENNEM